MKIYPSPRVRLHPLKTLAVWKAVREIEPIIERNGEMKYISIGGRLSFLEKMLPNYLFI